MSLKHNELITSIALLIKRDPIVNVSIDEETITLVHLSGKTGSLELSKKETNITNEVNHFHEIDYDKVRVGIHEYIDSLKPELVGESETVDYEKIEQLIAKQIDILKEHSEQKIEVPQTIIEQYDDSNIKNWVIDLIKTVENEIVELKETPNIIENTYKEEIDYTTVQTLIDDKLNAFIELDSKNVYVTNIFSKMGSIYLKYSNGSERDITNIIIPNIHVGTMGGGGSGPSGLSAYQIAVQYGFVGTEQQWLDSLSGGGGYIPPSNGTVNYDGTTGKISSIVKGSTTTTFNYDVNGVVQSIDNGSFVKTFTRDGNGKITGWTIT